MEWLLDWNIYGSIWHTTVPPGINDAFCVFTAILMILASVPQIVIFIDAVFSGCPSISWCSTPRGKLTAMVLFGLLTWLAISCPLGIFLLPSVLGIYFSGKYLSALVVCAILGYEKVENWKQLQNNIKEIVETKKSARAENRSISRSGITSDASRGITPKR